MAVFLVTWDLNREKPNYSQMRQQLIDRLSRYDHIKDPGLDSVWFLSSTSTAEQIFKDLWQVMHERDRIIITRLITGQNFGWLHTDIWAWINARL